MDQIVNIFLSYAHEDALLHDELVRHLSVLKNEGFANTWSDCEISAGSNWQQDIRQHLATADLILLLISADFIASIRHYSGEMHQALERHAAGQARVIPILLRAVDWQTAPFAHLQILPADGKPIDSQPNKDEAFQKIAMAIRGLAGEMLVERGQDHLTMGRSTQAVQTYRSALKLQPKMISARQGLAKALFSQGNVLLESNHYDKALASYIEALDIDSSDASNHVDKGYTLLHLHRYQDALTAFEDALYLNPHAASDYGEKGKALDELKKFKGDIAAIVEQMLPSLQLSQQEHSSNSPTLAVKVSPSAGTLLFTKILDGRLKDVAWPESGKIASVLQYYERGVAGERPAFIPTRSDRLFIWEASTGYTIWKEYDCSQIAWSRDGQSFAALRFDGSVEIKEYDTNLLSQGQPSHRPKSQSVSEMDSPREKIYKSPPKSYKEELERYNTPVTSIAWSPEGTRIASTYGAEVQIWKAPTGRVLDKYNGSMMPSSPYPYQDITGVALLNGVVWSPKGSYIASLAIAPPQSDGPSKKRRRGGPVLEPNASSRYRVIVWEVGTHRVIGTFEDPSGSISLPTWSPDENYLAAMGNKNIFIWEVRTGKTSRTYSNHAQDQDQEKTKKSALPWDIENKRSRVKWSPDGKYLASMSGKSVHIWETATGRTSLIYKGHFEEVTCITWSPDGTRIASGSLDKTVQIWLAVEE